MTSVAQSPTAALLALLLALCACGSHGGNAPAPELTDAAYAGQWLPFPPAITAGLSPYRTTSDDTLVVQGASFVAAQGTEAYELPAAEDYVLVSGVDEQPTWALYSIPDLSTERPVSLEISVAPAAAEPGGGEPLPLSCWIGVSDYSTFGWEWHGPLSESRELELNNYFTRDRYVSADHVLSFVVLTFTSSEFAGDQNPHGRTAARIDLARIGTSSVDGDYYFTRPHFPEISEATLGPEGKGGSELHPNAYVNLRWEHLADPADEDCEANKYYVYRRGPGNARRQLIGAVLAPTTQYTDPMDNYASAVDPVPGLTYTYYLRAGNRAGYSGYDRIPVDLPAQDTIVITDCTVRVENATGGMGSDPELFNQEHDYGVIVANSPTCLRLEWIDGTFNGLPFSGDDNTGWPEQMIQDDYDKAFSSARDNMEWHLSRGGDWGSRETDDWLVLDAGYFPVTGDPGPGAIFPDDDPESTGAYPEGILWLELPDDGRASYPADEHLMVSVPSRVYLELNVDVGFDPLAPVLHEYLDSTGWPLVYLPGIGDRLVRIPFDWGASGEPADLSQTSLELHEFEDGDDMRVAVDFTYTASDPAPGEFAYLNADGDSYIVCVIPGPQLHMWRHYCCRLSDGARWSSINKPDEMMYAPGPGLYAEELVTVPQHCGTEIDQLQIFFEDPVVRMEHGGGEALKINGEEFTIQSFGQEFYPSVIVKETADPYEIQFHDSGEPGVFVAERGPGRLVVDIAVLTPGGGPGDPDRRYSYRCFDFQGILIGQGHFTVLPIGVPAIAPSCIDWGVNVWDREERGLGGRDYGNKVLDGSTIGGARPDVLWFEFQDGWLYDWEQDDSCVHAENPYSETDNVVIRIEDQSTMEQMFLECSLRIAGIEPGLSWIVLHKPSAASFRNPGAEGWPGIFEPDHTYSVQLADPHFHGTYYTYGEALTVTGANPNP